MCLRITHNIVFLCRPTDTALTEPVKKSKKSKKDKKSKKEDKDPELNRSEVIPGTPPPTKGKHKKIR